MNNEKLNMLGYAEGFIEDFLDNYQTGDVNHDEQIGAMWSLITSGLRELRQENATLEIKVAAARNALL
jgi:hypothetical protein